MFINYLPRVLLTFTWLYLFNCVLNLKLPISWVSVTMPLVLIATKKYAIPPHNNGLLKIKNDPPFVRGCPTDPLVTIRLGFLHNFPRPLFCVSTAVFEVVGHFDCCRLCVQNYLMKMVLSFYLFDLTTEREIQFVILVQFLLVSRVEIVGLLYQNLVLRYALQVIGKSVFL